MYTDVSLNIDRFVSFLFSDSKEYRETVYVGILDNNKVMRELKYDISSLDRLKDLKYSKSCNYYITANTIKNNRSRKKSELFSLHNICIDIDLHTSKDDINKVADSFKYFLIEDCCEHIPKPNFLVRTGRGLQLWWHFEECSSKLLFMYQALSQVFITEISKMIQVVETLCNLKVDKSASTNVCGYFRLANTFNTKSQSFSSYEFLNEDTYNLCDLFDEYCEKETVSVNLQQVQFSQDKEYTSLIMKRKQFIEQYCERRNYDMCGSRDLVMFLYTVCLFQLIDSNYIMQSMKLLNSKFTKQLNQSQLDSIFRYVSKKKVLKFKQETFLNFLVFLTDEERKSYLESRERNATRDRKRKVNKVNKEERNRRIRELYYKSNLTMYEISKIEDINCSLRTVRRVLEDKK